MATQYLAAVPVCPLKSAVLTASNRHDEIVAAIDLLLQGFEQSGLNNAWAEASGHSGQRLDDTLRGAFRA